MKRLILVVFIALTAIVSCKKENTEEPVCITAMVHYGGDPLADGSGWVLVTDTTSGKFEAPYNLDASFKTEGLLVDICYLVTDKDFVCFCTPPTRKQVNITSIKLH
jgi:hypothetical protein